MMREAISVTGYAPEDINYCPCCGSTDIYFDSQEALHCKACELEVFLIEGDGDDEEDEV
jgi:NADH pyrophosphatase NudC (nudix superfamily)